jgi:hypothetical protein
MPKPPPIRLYLLPFLATLALPASSQTTVANTTQQLLFAGLRSVNAQGQINGVATDTGGNPYLLIDQNDGIRILHVSADGTTVLAQAYLGATGDHGTALALDPTGNICITGTTSSGSLSSTAGAAFPSASPNTTTSFVAKFTPALTESFLTFTGGTRIAASAIAASDDAIFVTGIIYGSDLPVSPTAIGQAPAYQSTQNGFVEAFSNDGTTLRYATYITGADGDTTPTSIAVDSSDDAYLVGSTTASGFPTIAAIIPNILSNPSGFLERLTPAGDGITFSTFVPGLGLNSIALDSTGQILLVSGTVALNQFPIDTVYKPLIPTNYQTLLRFPLDGSSVLSGTVIAPGTQSALTPALSGTVWLGGIFGTIPALPQPALATIGNAYSVHFSAATGIDQTLRLGGISNQSQSFAGIPVLLNALTIDPSGNLFLAGAVQPSASASLLPTETFDLPLLGSPTSAFPSSIANAEPLSSACTGSLCSGSASFLAIVSPSTSAPAIAVSTNDIPFLVFRNLGSSAAQNLQFAVSSGGLSSTCPGTLPPGGECDILLTGNHATTLTITTSNANPATLQLPAYSTPIDTLAFAPKELDFGIQTSSSAPSVQTITVTNLGSAQQDFASGIPALPGIVSPFSQSSSDCPLSSTTTGKTLAPGATCHINVAFTASSSASNDSSQLAEWSIGSRQVQLTGYTQAATLSVSATEIDFGTVFQSGINLPRYLYLSNASASPASHTAVSLPANSAFTVADGCPSQIPASSVCRIRIDYTSPIAPSTDTTNLTLDQGLSVLITGQTQPPPTVGGATANPNLSVSPTSVTFTGSVVVTGVSSSTQTVAITNTRASPIPLSISIVGDFIETNGCSSTLAAGATCAVAIQFAPSQPGTRTGLLNITSGQGTSPLPVALTGTATGILAANNGTLAFGPIPIGQPKTNFYKITQPFSALTVSATGPFLVTLVEDSGFGPGNPPSSSFIASGTGTCHNCWVGVRFQPETVGTQTGTLSFSSASAGSPYVLNLTGSGISTTGLVLSPNVQIFGAIPVNSETGTTLFTLTNLSSPAVSITITSTIVTGKFAIVSGADPTATCGTLVWSASCSVSVAFNPTALGAASGTLTFNTSLGTVSAELSGTGTTDPGVAISPSTLTFSSVAGPSASQQTVTVTNTSPGTIQVGTPTVLTPQFSALTNCGSLAQSASCTINVTYQPTTSPVTDTLSIPILSPGSGGTTQNSTYQVALIGASTSTSLGLATYPATLAFGPVAVAAQSTPRLFTIENFTNKALTLKANVPRNFAILGTPCTTLAPNTSCSESLQFVPLTNGDLPGTLSIQATPTDGSPALTTLFYADGYGIGTGQLTISGGLIINGVYNFGQITPGQTASHTFTLTNQGLATAPAINIRRITSAPPFLASTTCASPITVGTTCTIAVTYTPTGSADSTTIASDSGILVIESDAQSSPNFVDLVGQSGSSTSSSTPPLATFTLSTGSLSFPATPVGDPSAPQIITLTNTGNTLLQILSATTTTDFSVQNGCTAVSVGNTCTLTVSSAPQASGTHIAALEIATNGATALDFVTLFSVATSSSLTITPSSLDFGQVQIGAASTLSLQVSNTGAAPITFNSIQSTGPYSVTGTCPASGATLSPTASCTEQVTFTPLTTGTLAGTLAFSTSASTAAILVPLTGVGITSKLSVNPTALNFGSILLGSSANLQLTLANQGTAPLTGLEFTTTGDFDVSKPCAQTTLAPATFCTIEVTFTPTAVGLRTGTLTIASSDPNSPTIVPLTGTGLANASFTLSVASGASATVSIPSGALATYPLLASPVGGFSGTIALTCNPVQTVPYALCSIVPSQLNLGFGPQSATASINTIQTTTSSAQLSSPLTTHPDRTFFTLLLPGVILMFRRRKNPRIWLGQAISIAALIGILCLSGCGHNAISNAKRTPAGTYQFVVTGNSTSGVQLTQTVTLNLIVTN